MILITDTTDKIVFNKNFNFKTNYVTSTLIEAQLEITNKVSKYSTTYNISCTDDEDLRYFEFIFDTSFNLTTLDQGTYSFTLKLKKNSSYVDYIEGILTKEIKEEDNEIYRYEEDADDAFIYDNN